MLSIHLHFHVTAALFPAVNIWKPHKCSSTGDWMRKNIYTVDYYPNFQKNKILTFITKWMQLEITVLNEISQTPPKNIRVLH